MAAAKGIAKHNDPSLLVEHGGPVEIGKKWSVSLLSRMGYVKKKATKAARHLPMDFDDVRSSFLKRLNDVVKEHSIPPEFIVNFDQTGIKIIPSSQWTTDTKGEKQVDFVLQIQ